MTPRQSRNHWTVAPAEKIAVVLNSFDEERWAPEQYVRDMPRRETFTLICHGTIEPNYGLDLVVRELLTSNDCNR